MTDWGKGAAKAEFAFDPPPEAQLTDLKKIPDLDEVSGVFVIKGAN